jgi:Protein of unknown function (DUF2971)
LTKPRAPRRKYGSAEASTAALKSIYNSMWKRYLEPANPPAKLYHYCREATFQEIVKSGNLWASDVLCMNDPKEIAYAFDVLGPLVAERENGSPKYFLKSIASPERAREIWGAVSNHIACFSSNPDLPSQWKHYAKCTGYALGFNRSALQSWCLARNISLFPVLYDSTLQTAMIKEFLEKEKQLEIVRDAAALAIRDAAVGYMHCLTLTLKDPAWLPEHEWRMLVIQPKDSTRFTRFTRDRDVGYFKLPIVVPELVAEIVLGPECVTDADQLKLHLVDVGLGRVGVRRASCGCEDSSDCA